MTPPVEPVADPLANLTQLQSTIETLADAKAGVIKGIISEDMQKKMESSMSSIFFALISNQITTKQWLQLLVLCFSIARSAYSLASNCGAQPSWCNCTLTNQLSR